MSAQHPPQVVPLSDALLGIPKASSFTYTRVFVSLCVLLVFLAVAQVSRRTQQRGKIGVRSTSKSTRTILLVGPLAAGKTSLFSKLLYGSTPPTHTSMKENEGVLKARWSEREKEIDEKDFRPLDLPVHLVDLPGHPRLRTRSLAQFLPAADGVVFVVDGNTGLGGKQIRDAGEHLQVFLSLLSLLQSSSSRHSSPLPVLILLSKSDLGTSSSGANTTVTLDRARQSLSRELERRRLASSTASASRSAGARLEGLEAIPSGASGSSAGWFNAVLSAFGLGGASSSSLAISSIGPGTLSAGLPSDEAEVLASADAFPFEGAFEWDKLEQAGVCELTWAVGNVKGKNDGNGQVWDWIEKQT